jgi:hypothetical protein
MCGNQDLNFGIDRFEELAKACSLRDVAVGYPLHLECPRSYTRRPCMQWETNTAAITVKYEAGPDLRQLKEDVSSRDVTNSMLNIFP